MGFPTKNDQHLGCEMGVPPFKETPIHTYYTTPANSWNPLLDVSGRCFSVKTVKPCLKTSRFQPLVFKGCMTYVFCEKFRDFYKGGPLPVINGVMGPKKNLDLLVVIFLRIVPWDSSPFFTTIFHHHRTLDVSTFSEISKSGKSKGSGGSFSGVKPG